MRVTELPRTTLGDLVLELSESGRVHKLLWDDAPPPPRLRMTIPAECLWSLLFLPSSNLALHLPAPWYLVKVSLVTPEATWGGF